VQAQAHRGDQAKEALSAPCRITALRFHCRHVQDLHWSRRLLHVGGGDRRVRDSLGDAQFGCGNAPPEIGLALVVRMWFPRAYSNLAARVS
jgi:hypothetical protein